MCNKARYKDGAQAAFPKWEFRQIRIDPPSRFVVHPSQPMPVVTVKNGEPEISMMDFGFPTKRGRQLMARSETVESLKSFKDAFASRRCLIIANGFFDNLDMGAFRQPWHIHLRDDRFMCFAGLWRTDGSFTIISTRANPVVARVIDRMPAILDPSMWQAWLDHSTPEKTLKSMLQPYAAEEMEAYPVTRAVNKPGFDSPEAIEPVIPAQGELDIF